jgi:hypothetical protein
VATNARLTQQGFEVPRNQAPTARVTQEIIEPVFLPTGNARVTQHIIEIMLGKPLGPNGHNGGHTGGGDVTPATCTTTAACPVKPDLLAVNEPCELSGLI